MTDKLHTDMPHNGGLPEEKLMAYLQGTLPTEETHEVEQWLAQDGPESDAIEGLQQLQAAEAQQAVNKINRHLQTQLHGSKRRHKAITSFSWAWISVGLLLLLAVLAYIVIHMVVKR